MVEQAAVRARDPEQESWERLRYSLLEQLYWLTGENCEHAVSLGEIEAQLQVSAPPPDTLIEDLVRWGYVQPEGTGSSICITEKGIRYLRQDAWRRRTIRG